MATITSFSVSEQCNLSAQIAGSSNGSSQSVRNASVSGATNGTVLPFLVYTPSFGNGTGQANVMYADSRTLAANATDNIKLSNLTNPVSGTFGFSTISRVVIALSTTPAANTVLYVGPQGNAAACPLWFGNTTVTSYDTVWQKLDNSKPIGGWSVANTTGDILPIHNAGNASINYAILVWGVQAGT